MMKILNNLLYAMSVIVLLLILVLDIRTYAIGSSSSDCSNCPLMDYDHDDDVDSTDLAMFSAYYTYGNLAADLTDDGNINFLDLEIFAAGFGIFGYSAPEDFDHIYDVGPGMEYNNPSEVPWESLEPNTLVRIHFREEPYAAKWVIAVSGTDGSPIVVRGILDNGKRPVITGDDATTRLALDYWNENRSVLKIGGSSRPSEFPEYIIIENLEIKSARPAYSFTNDSGYSGNYSSNAAAIHVEMGSHIIIRNCILHDCANGFFAGSQASDLLLEKNHIYNNGIENSIYQHNNYTECLGITFQYNHFGPLRQGCKGNNLKDRSAGTLIRYNWIEAGNRTIDLVESDHEDLLNDPSYSQTHVYGNILIKHDVQENGQVLHYGGDGGDYSKYRKGTLWFFNNTIVSYRSGNTTLFGLSSNDEHVESFNNIVYAVAGGSRLAVMGEKGVVNLYHNWLNQEWKPVHGTLLGTLTASGNIVGNLPGFNNFSARDYSLSEEGPCLNAGTGLPPLLLPDHNLLHQYVEHQGYRLRPIDGILDLGAFEAEINKSL
jgi:hypothetical protein